MANFSMLYTVEVSEDPRQGAKVRVELFGANEIRKIVWQGIDPEWFDGIHASGRLLRNGPSQWTWYPDAVTGDFSYQVVLTRARDMKGFDSFHGGSWVLTRTSDLFPLKRFTSRGRLRALTRVRFVLPAGWQVVSALRGRGDTTFEARDRGKALTAPYGWVLMGRLDVENFTAKGVMVKVASPSVIQYDAAKLIDLLKRVIPRLKATVRTLPKQITVAVGPDPLWRGGLSGEDSLYLNQNLPLIARDYTSTAVHELFHVVQGFRKADRRASWVVEGLAEYYSLKSLREIGAISRQRFVRGIRKFDRHGLWGRNFLSATQHNVLYNAAPLLFFYFDELIRKGTDSKHSLRSVVKDLGSSYAVSTETLRTALEKVAPQIDWKTQFQRHVLKGRRPSYEKYLQRYK